MTQYGYALSSEEHGPIDLVRYARMAEDGGFSFALISDHYHPWIDRQGHSPFVWNVIGGIAGATERLSLGTGVTCPTMRIHPAIIAQAAATSAAMMPGRFFLGVGTGENLNEHILGDHWPPYELREEMLREAVEVIRTLWSGKTESFYGDYYTVEDARIYTLPEELPAIMVAAGGPQAARMAGEIGDGLITTSPDGELMQEFRAAGGKGKPTYGQIACCWAATEEEGRRTAFEWWPTAGLKGQLGAELRIPAYFEQAVQMVSQEEATGDMAVGPDPAKYVAAIEEFEAAGYDHIYIHQIGPDQAGFIRFFEREIRPRLSGD
jgi:G6PDH family F420-dependent oxidoreductase